MSLPRILALVGALIFILCWFMEGMKDNNLMHLATVCMFVYLAVSEKWRK